MRWQTYCPLPHFCLSLLPLSPCLLAPFPSKRTKSHNQNTVFHLISTSWCKFSTSVESKKLLELDMSQYSPPRWESTNPAGTSSKTGEEYLSHGLNLDTGCLVMFGEHESRFIHREPSVALPIHISPDPPTYLMKLFPSSSHLRKIWTTE